MGDLLALARLLRSAAVTHINYAYPVGKYQLLAAAMTRLLRRRSVATHHLVLDIGALGLGRLKTGFWRAAYRRCGQWLDRHIALSETAHTALVRAHGFPPDRVVTIANGVDLSAWHPAADRPSRQAARRTIGEAVAGTPWDDRVALVLTVARLSPQKGIADLISAVSPVIQQIPAARFVVAGDGELMGPLREAIRNAGLGETIFLVGRRPPEELAGWLPACDLFVLPSRAEGAPFALIEAMACACPIVATAVGGVAELLGNGECGRTVPPAAPAELAAAIVALLQQPEAARAMGARARERAVARFDAYRSSLRTIAVYDRLIDGARPKTPT